MRKIFIILTSLPLLVIAQQTQSAAQDTFNFNNVKTIVGSGAMMWDNLNKLFEIPKGSDKHTIFAHDFWIGGIDEGGQLRVAAQTYRQNGADFWAGPCSDPIHHNDIDMGLWDRVWKINKTEIDYHITNFNSSNYIMLEAIETWPAHGDINMGQSENLAPFVDVDNDGIYNPSTGDYPQIKGDQAIYFIRNDIGNVHTEYGGEKLGIEQHIMFYGYRCNNYPELNNALFVNMKLYNRGEYNLQNMYVGTWTDVDLGYYIDDYIGCNVPLNLGYVYNGDSIDEGQNGYGTNPPTQGVVYLNQNMSKFFYYWGSPTFVGNPDNAQDIYYFLQGRWKNGQHLMFGANGLGAGSPGSTTDSCSYFFPGTTDPDFPEQDWTEYTAENTPFDRRFLQSHGPIDLPANSSFNLDYAFIFAWDSTGINGGSLPLLFSYTQSIQDFYDGSSIILCENEEIPITWNCINDNCVDPNDGTGLYNSLPQCQTSCSQTAVNELLQNKKKLTKIINLLGKETFQKTNTPLFYIYDDGSVEKRFVID